MADNATAMPTPARQHDRNQCQMTASNETFRKPEATPEELIWVDDYGIRLGPDGEEFTNHPTSLRLWTRDLSVERRGNWGGMNAPSAIKRLAYRITAECGVIGSETLNIFGDKKPSSPRFVLAIEELDIQHGMYLTARLLDSPEPHPWGPRAFEHMVAAFFAEHQCTASGWKHESDSLFGLKGGWYLSIGLPVDQVEHLVEEIRRGRVHNLELLVYLHDIFRHKEQWGPFGTNELFILPCLGHSTASVHGILQRITWKDALESTDIADGNDSNRNVLQSEEKAHDSALLDERRMRHQASQAALDRIAKLIPEAAIDAAERLETVLTNRTQASLDRIVDRLSASLADHSAQVRTAQGVALQAAARHRATQARWLTIAAIALAAAAVGIWMR